MMTSEMSMRHNKLMLINPLQMIINISSNDHHHATKIYPGINRYTISVPPNFQALNIQGGGESDIQWRVVAFAKSQTSRTIAVIFLIDLSSPCHENYTTSRLIYYLGAVRISHFESKRERLAINLSGWLLHGHPKPSQQYISSSFHRHATKITPQVD